MNKPHKHWRLMRDYAQDAAETEKPWERWQYMSISGQWSDFGSTSPMWDEDIDYRRKPRTININGFEVPEPIREKPEKEIEYYLCGIPAKRMLKWRDDSIDNQYFELGICHSTREAAELHAKALLSFTQKEETK